MNRPLHVVPLERAGRDHSASSTCWCSPLQSFRDLSTGLPVYRHRQPPPAPPGPRERAALRDFERFAAAPWIEREDRTDG